MKLSRYWDQLYVNILSPRFWNLRFTLIFDTIVDQLSMIIRYIHVDRENNIVTVNETSLGFIVALNSSALGLTMSAVKYFESVGYAVSVPVVHCTNHILNLVINDAAEARISRQICFGTIEEIYLFLDIASIHG